MKFKNVIQKKFNERKPIIAINIESYDQYLILSKIAKEINNFIIIQFSSRNIEWIFSFYQDVLTTKNNPNIFFHLDHCDSSDIIKKCISLGFDSVMYDGSHYTIDHNISKTNFYYKLAKEKNCLLEVEVGPIAGVEDGFGSETGAYFKLPEAIKMTKEGEFDLLALTIGNAHGEYKTTSSIRPDLLEEFQKSIPNSIPLVLHGGTGIPNEILKKCVNLGCVKINYSTDFKKSFVNLKKLCSSHNQFIDQLTKDYSNKIKNFYKIWY